MLINDDELKEMRHYADGDIPNEWWRLDYIAKLLDENELLREALMLASRYSDAFEGINQTDWLQEAAKCIVERKAKQS